MQTEHRSELEQTALLVVDVQCGLFNRPRAVYRAERLLETINALLDTAHACGMPVCVVQHENKRILAAGSENWQLHPALHMEDHDLLFRKQHGSAFQGTALDRELAGRGVRTIWVTGLVSHGCVQATCQDGHARGYTVILVEDGHSNYHRDAAWVIRECHCELQATGVATVMPAQALTSGRHRTTSIAT